MIQIPTHGKTWLILLPALLLAAVGLYARPVNTVTAVEGAVRSWAKAVAFIGAAGALYILAQGFAISSQGYAFESLKAAMPAISGGQFGMDFFGFGQDSVPNLVIEWLNEHNDEIPNQNASIIHMDSAQS